MTFVVDEVWHVGIPLIKHSGLGEAGEGEGGERRSDIGTAVLSSALAHTIATR